MDIETLTRFFMWCTILSAGVFVFWSTMCVMAPDFVYRTQSKWIPISREVFDVSIYAFLGMAKIVFVFFCLVPYLALSIIG